MCAAISAKVEVPLGCDFELNMRGAFIHHSGASNLVISECTMLSLDCKVNLNCPTETAALLANLENGVVPSLAAQTTPSSEL